jgi:hypothetical protein
MFDHLHYVPILRWKGGERGALKELRAADRQLITPILEYSRPGEVQSREDDDEGAYSLVEKLKADVLRSWGYSAAFFDALWLHATLPSVQRSAEVIRFFREIADSGGRLIPVTGFHRGTPFQTLTARLLEKKCSSSVCLRLVRQDIDRPKLAHEIDALLELLGVGPSSVDLVVDLQFIDSSGFTLSPMCSRLPRLTEWRTFAVVAGAFPKDLTGFGKGIHRFPRYDWRTWKGEVGLPLARKPAFGDYATLHPVLARYVPGMNTSASIRYTLDEEWLVMRGEGLRNEGGPGHKQYHGQAQLLTSRKEYSGRDFSYGDAYIYEVGKKKEQTGTPTTWIRAGVNHHLTLVARQIASLSSS